jgi:hypothetical protein
MGKLRRHLLIIAAVAVTATSLSGCVIIKSNSSTQLNGIGAIQVTTTFCASDGDSNNPGYTSPDPSCQGAGTGGNANANAANVGAGSLQLLIAYRIPTPVTAPDAITTTNPGGGSAITFSQSPSFTSELQRLAPAGSGQRWVGYLSSATGYNQATNQYFTVAPQFTLQRSDGGSAFEGPFNYRVTVGLRRVNGTFPASRPVTCGSSLTSIGNDGPGEFICVDSPSAASLSSNLTQTTQDLGILDAPGTQSVNQGKVARIKFSVDYAGDGNPAPDFDLNASTNIPGATALSSTPLLAPQEGSNEVRVITRVPVSTPPGHYDVTLTASLPTGETRTSTHDVLVTPTTVRCDVEAPTIAGTRDDDVLVGTRGPDVIAAYAGDDEVLGLSGNDLICTGKGDDTIRGGGGNDRIAGRRGNDLLTGGSGKNVIDTGPGKDRMIQ